MDGVKFAVTFNWYQLEQIKIDCKFWDFGIFIDQNHITK